MHTRQVLVFTRQALPQLPNTSIEGTAKGGYVIHDDSNPQIVFVASGSEVYKTVELPIKAFSGKLQGPTLLVVPRTL